MNPAIRNTLLWLVGGSLMVAMALVPLQAAYLDGEYLPAHADAFYHARRILDVVMTGQPVMQFDPKIHVPEGSWIPWPWTYDSVLAWITKGFGPFANESEATRMLMHVPVAVGVMFIGLVLLVGTQLELSFLLRTLLVLGMAALPVVSGSFAVGNVDHHFAELLWTVLVLASGLWFARTPEKSAAAICLGLALATANGVHNSMFVLQFPVVLYFGLRWLRGQALPPARSMLAFAISLVLGTLLICVPSQPWQKGSFEFYSLSWFQLYIAGITGAFCAVLARVPRKPANVAMLSLAALLALLPMVHMLSLAGSFMSGRLDMLQDILEVKSPYQLYLDHGSRGSTAQLSWLMWLYPLSLLFNIDLARRTPDAALQFFAVLAIFGLTLMQLQYRFHVFGDLSMVATPLLAIQMAQRHRPGLATRLGYLAAVGMIVAYLPTAPAWNPQRLTAGQQGYREFAPVFPVMREACAERPGIVLGNVHAGHWVRYHSACSVIANVFLLTPQHAAKVESTRQLMALSPQQLAEATEGVRYVFVFHSLALSPAPTEPPLDIIRQGMSPLESQLLAPVPLLPASYRLLWEKVTPGGQIFARFYEIERHVPANRS
jgi:hypothetical protein